MNEQVNNAIGGYEAETIMGDTAKAGGSASNGAGTLQLSPTLDLQATIARLQELDKARTQGEWRYKYRAREDGMYAGEVFDVANQTIATMAWHIVPTSVGLTTDREYNGAFIAAAPTMMQVIRKQQAELDAHRRINGLGGERELALMAKLNKSRDEARLWKARYDYLTNGGSARTDAERVGELGQQVEEQQACIDKLVEALDEYSCGTNCNAGTYKDGICVNASSGCGKIARLALAYVRERKVV